MSTMDWKKSLYEKDSDVREFAVPEGVSFIDSECFANNARIEHVILPASLRDIGVGAFAGCTSLRSINIPEGVTRLRKSTFTGCHSLYEVTLPESLIGIGEWAFRDCPALKKIRIPQGVTDICAEVFLGDSDLVIEAEPGSFAEEYALKFGISLNLP